MSVCVSERQPLKSFERNIYKFLDVYNKIDAIGLEQVDKIARQPQSLVISCEMGLK
jgi:ribosome-interacting GTPase 1